MSFLKGYPVVPYIHILLNRESLKVILFLEDVGEAVRRRRLRVAEDGVLQ